MRRHQQLCRIIEYISLRSGDDLLFDNVDFLQSPRLRFLPVVSEVELLLIPPYAPWLNAIEGAFCIVKHYDSFTRRIAEAFSAR